MTTTEVSPTAVVPPEQSREQRPPDPEATLVDYTPEFDTFYRATYGGVVAVAHSMTGDRHLGEEIAQSARCSGAPPRPSRPTSPGRESVSASS
jgi:hypothetical protein